MAEIISSVHESAAAVPQLHEVITIIDWETAYDILKLEVAYNRETQNRH